MNRKGQALVEFVLILPIFIFILFAIIDFGNIYNTKNELENDSTSIVEMFKNDNELNYIKNMYRDLNIDIVKIDDEYSKIEIDKNVKIITPGLNRIFGKIYKVKVERVVPYV